MIEPGTDLLRLKYRIISGPITTDDAGQTWLGIDEDDTQYLIKTWAFRGERPDDFGRALWDAELRTLYRVGSSPGAEGAILVLRDAGVDLDNRCFVMVMVAPGYESLSSVIRHRTNVPWLATGDPEVRLPLWASVLQLALGIRLLHEQHILHRDIRADAVFFNSQLGTDSFRLGGFEWSVRLATPSAKAPPASWSSPPEFFGSGAFGHRLETDWFGFGMLAARLFLNLEPHANNEPVQRHKQVLSRLDRPGVSLSEMERAFLRRLITRRPEERITRGYEVITTIQDILRALEHRARSRSGAGPLVLVINPWAVYNLLDEALDAGFVPNPDEPHEAFNPNNVRHVANLGSFLRRDLDRAQLYAVPRVEYYLLVGARLSVRITAFREIDRSANRTTETWDLAFCHGVAGLGRNEGGTACVDLPRGSIVVRDSRSASRRSIRQGACSWEHYLPTIDQAVALRASLAQFHEFLRCTNQLELLIRDSEIFRFRMVRGESVDGVERLVIRETERERRVAAFCEIEGGMAEFLLREKESGKPDGGVVVLTDLEEDGFMLPSRSKAESWRLGDIDASRGYVELSRITVGGNLRPAPREGYLRMWGMFGQIALIRRRKRAIDRIITHSYLLRSLSAPGQVYMDTGAVPLPVPLESSVVDEAKQAAIEDVVRVRPIYALQGPPGTGKTTLVAYLLRQIFEDDPVAQVLITAQAHGAVDVLRTKVRDEAFRGVPEDKQPLAVRLRPPVRDSSGAEDGSAEEVSRQILVRAKEYLQRLRSRTDLQDEWLKSIVTMEESLAERIPDSTARDFCELVKRGASITFCTTSAGDLEVLADATQSFDWAIIEEAGKAHGFDLALPLQAGHRWLLIGDHRQLPPYRFKDYREGIDSLETAVEALYELPQRAGGLLDVEWIQSWRDREDEQQKEFKEYARRWLNSFERIFEYCSVATGLEKRTLNRADGAAAGRLSHQHRMHPTIGDLISGAYYDGDLVNRTVDERGGPLSRVCHPFRYPEEIVETAIVWLDLPWAARDSDYAELGPSTGHPRYTNPKEVDAISAFFSKLGGQEGINVRGQGTLTLAVLSPYNQQVALINHRLRQDTLRAAGLTPKHALRSRNSTNDQEDTARFAHTVDSFQGNQADVIAVSLVRNNKLPTGKGLGFLEESTRINVLLSRAERLLVLTGSWEFFQEQLTAVALDDPQDPLWHWKKVLVTMEEWFGTGRAVRIQDTTHSEDKRS